MRISACLLAMQLYLEIAVGQTTLRTDTTLVLVPTLVQTAGRELATSLTAKDFVVTDNGVPQTVTLEDETSRPLALVVLVQTGGVARAQFPSYTHLTTMLDEVLGRGRNKIAIVNFDSGIEGASPFTTDVEEWRDAIEHPEPGDGGAAILDGLAYGLKLLREEPATTRRAILLISQGHDSGSKVTEKELLRTIGETSTTIYSMTFSAERAEVQQAFRDPPHLNPPLPGVGQAYFNLSAPIALALGAMKKNLAAEVATLSGGEASGFANRGELEADLGTLANHIRSRYLLSFRPTSKAPGLHPLATRVVGHPELVVAARSSYWAV